MNRRSYLLFRIKDLKSLLRYAVAQSPVSLTAVRVLTSEINKAENSLESLNHGQSKLKTN